MRRIHVREDVRCELHEAPPGHPESPARLHALRRAIEERAQDLVLCETRPAEDEELLAAHPREHLDRIRDAARRAPSQLDADTFVSAASADVARLAAGAAVDCLAEVAGGTCEAGLAAVRPPGHHAEANRAMGFCLFNNVAAAVQSLRESGGAERVAILDWDVHHGNGTQHLFDTERDVLYSSVHQFPFYPGTGAVGEIGIGRGEGSTLNIPLPAGCGDAVYQNAVDRLVGPAFRQFAPDLIVVSCGFDAHDQDPLGQMRVSTAGYGALTHQLRALAESVCEGRIAFVLEGGYSPVGLRESTGALLDALLAEEAESPTLPTLPAAHSFWGVADALVGNLGGRIPGLGARS